MNSNCRNSSAFTAKCLAEVKYSHDVCRATNGAHNELALSLKKLSELLFTMM
jgi:hypothetical protein